MKPAPFVYLAPDSLDAALEALAEHGADAKVLAGGQSLIPVMNFRLAQPAVLVDLNRIGELDFIEEGNGGLRIGGMTRQSRVEHDPGVRRLLPLLHEAMPHIAHPQIRNRGTIGGTLAHADPAAELPAVAVALGGRVRLVSLGGERWVPAAEFFRSLFTTALEPGEIVAELELPPPAERTGYAFLEVARRQGDYAQVGIAASLGLDESGVCCAARLVYFSVGDRPMEAAGAARVLVGERPSEALFGGAAEHAALQEIDPSGDIHASAAFKRHLAEVLTRRVLSLAFTRAGGTE